METGMTDKRQGRHTEHLRTKIAAGYIVIFLLVGGIVHLWVDEWRKLETFETENHRINALRMEVHDVYVRVEEGCHGQAAGKRSTRSGERSYPQRQ